MSRARGAPRWSLQCVFLWARLCQQQVAYLGEHHASEWWHFPILLIWRIISCPPRFLRVIHQLPAFAITYMEHTYVLLGATWHFWHSTQQDGHTWASSLHFLPSYSICVGEWSCAVTCHDAPCAHMYTALHTYSAAWIDSICNQMINLRSAAHKVHV